MQKEIPQCLQMSPHCQEVLFAERGCSCVKALSANGGKCLCGVTEGLPRREMVAFAKGVPCAKYPSPSPSPGSEISSSLTDLNFATYKLTLFISLVSFIIDSTFHSFAIIYK